MPETQEAPYVPPRGETPREAPAEQPEPAKAQPEKPKEDKSG